MGKRKYKSYHRINEQGVAEKYCPDCDKWFEMNDKNFNVQPKQPDGFSSRCTPCQTKYNHESYMKNQRRNIDNSIRRQKELYEQGIGKVKRHEQYVKRMDRYNSSAKIYKKEHPEWYKKFKKDYYKNNPEKFKQYSKNHRNHDITTNEWTACKDFFKNENGEWICAYCGRTEKEGLKKFGDRLHKDHTDYEGNNDISNCTPSCKSCNDRKWKFNMEEWFREQEFFSEEKLIKINQWNNEEYKKYIESKPPYRIVRSRTYNNDGTWILQHELWTVDEKRNIVDKLVTKPKKQDLKNDIEIYIKNINTL